MKRLGLLVAICGIAVLAIAAPASAHATLESVDPAPGTVSQRAPTQLTLRFNEPVSAPGGSIRCFDGNGKRIDTGAPKYDGVVVTMKFPKQLRDSGYVCTWRITSADGHAVTGTTNFTVGTEASAGLDSLSARVLNQVANDPLVTTLLSIASGVTYAGLALLIGPAFFLAQFASGWRTRPRPRLLLAIGWSATLLGSVATLLLDGPYIEGRGVGAMFDGPVLGTALDGRVGQAALARIVITVGSAALVRSLQTPDELRRWWRPAAAVTGTALAVTVAASGHSTAGSLAPVWIVVAALHVVAMSIWLGGLALLVAESLPSGEQDADLRTGLQRFSPIALTAVIIIAITGVMQAYREVETIDALVSTTYGAILLAKIAAFIVAIAIAANVRRAARSDDAEVPPSARKLLAIECAFAVVALALTAALTSTTPAKTAYAQQGATAFITAKSLDFDVSLTAATDQGRQLHVLVLDHRTGQQTAVDELAVIWSKGELGPIESPVSKVADGHYVVDTVQLPGTGEWTLTLRARTGNFNQTVGVTKLRVG
ncbi:MAG: copper resistance CopC/CopD family protein [Acidimicrobiia bacterium]